MRIAENHVRWSCSDDALANGILKGEDQSASACMQVCGAGQGVIGDAVVPLPCTFLDGAENIEIPGVFHSMSTIGTYDAPGGKAIDLFVANAAEKNPFRIQDLLFCCQLVASSCVIAVSSACQPRSIWYLVELSCIALSDCVCACIQPIRVCTSSCRDHGPNCAEYPWYGSREVVDLWLRPLLAELDD